MLIAGEVTMNSRSRASKTILIIVLVVLLVGFIVFNIVLYQVAKDTLILDESELPILSETPADYGLEYEDVTVVTEDGYELHSWYVPGTNGATIIVQHGSPGGKQDSFYEAEFLNREGFNILFGSFRAHDDNDGDLTTFGAYEVKDMAAWHQYLLTRDDIDSQRIGIFGESMGGGTAILYTSDNEDIAAIATGSAFAFTIDTVKYFIEYEMNPPDWVTPIIARTLLFWAQQYGDFDDEDVDTEAVVCDISPRPILILNGLSDDKIGPDNGRLLYDAACEPREIWECEECGHVNFEKHRPEEYQQKLLTFFQTNLLEE